MNTINVPYNLNIKSLTIIFKGFFVFGVIFLFSGLFLGLLYELYGYSNLEVDNMALTLWYIFYFYCSYFFGYCFLKNIYDRNFDCVNLNQVFNWVLLLLVAYYLVILKRYYFDDVKHGLYGLRLYFGFIYPFWILTPIFILKKKSGFYAYVCAALCIVEATFWFLLFKLNGSTFYESPSFTGMLISSAIFSLSFPWYVIWLQKIDFKKYTSLLFIKKYKFISRAISLIGIFLGGIFMFLFYFTF